MVFAALWSFASGTCVLIALSYLVAKGNWWQTVSIIPSQPWWLLIGGLVVMLCGLFIFFLAKK